MSNTAQTIMYAEKSFKFTDKFRHFNRGLPTNDIKELKDGSLEARMDFLPNGVTIVDMAITIDTPFAGPTAASAAAAIGNNMVSASLIAAGETTTVSDAGDRYKRAAKGELELTLGTFSAPSTGGEFTVKVSYVKDDRVCEVI